MMRGKCLYGIGYEASNIIYKKGDCYDKCPAYIDVSDISHRAFMTDTIYEPVSCCAFVNQGILPQDMRR